MSAGYSTYARLGVHVYASSRAVIRAMRARFNPPARHDPQFREARHYWYRLMLRHHRDAQRLVQRYRL